ncbi:hypothetical protein T310_10167, partial [Rasamsonia emersonii CBS 393.64]
EIVTSQQNGVLSNTATQDETLPRKAERVRHTRSRDSRRSIDKIRREVQYGPRGESPTGTDRRKKMEDQNRSYKRELNLMYLAFYYSRSIHSIITRY